MAEDGAAQDTGISTSSVADVAVSSWHDGQGAVTNTSEGRSGELDVIASHRCEAEVGSSGEVQGRDGETGVRAIGIHGERTTIDGDGRCTKRRASGGLGEQGGTIADGRGGMGVGTGQVAIEDHCASAVDGEEAGTCGKRVVCVGLACGDINAARTGHVDDTVGKNGAVHQQLATVEGEAGRKDRCASETTEISIAGDTEDTGVDGGVAKVGVGVAENQGAEAGLGEAGLCADVGEVTADHTGGGKSGRCADVDGAALNELHVVGDRKVLVPSSEGTGVEKDIARKITRGAERQGAGADRSGGVAIATIGEAEDTSTRLDESGSTGNRAGKGDDTGGVSNVECAIGCTGEVDGTTEGQVDLRLGAATDEGVGRKGTDRVTRSSKSAENTGAGEVDRVTDGHRLEQADGGGHTETSLVNFKGTAVEADGTRAESTCITHTNNGVAIDGGAERVCIRSVEDDGATVADEVGSGCAADRADDNRTSSGEDRCIDLKRAAAGA